MSGTPPSSGRGRTLALDLAARVGSHGVSCEPADLWAASRDVSTPGLLRARAGMTPVQPDVVVWPRDTAEVAEVIRFAAGRQIPVVPSGGATGVAGGALPVRGGIVLSTRRLTEPFALDLPGRTLETAAGISGAELAERLARGGATLGHFPPDRGTGTVGGWLATRSAGYAASRYGKIEELTLALEAVDGTGEVLRTLDGPTAGPDLTQLLLGSEGTLAVLTSARLRVWPAPTSRWFRAVRFPSLAEGARVLRSILRGGLRPSLARLQDPLETLSQGSSVRLPRPLQAALEGAGVEALRLALRSPTLLNAVVEALPGAAILLLGFEGQGEEEVEDEGEAALALCAAAGAADLGPGHAERELSALDQAAHRRSSLFAAGVWSDTIDLAATWDRALLVREAVRRAVAPHALVFGGVTHAYLEGCALELQCLGLAGATDEDPDESIAAYQAVLHAALNAAADAGATLSHGSGLGLSRKPFLLRELGDGVRQLRALKKAFDPHGILNPGKLLP